MAIDINIRADVTRVTRALSAFAEKQIPFATAQALNSLGALIKAGEQDNIKKHFPTATPFTVKSVGLSKARKANPTITIFVKDIAARYLLPYEDGGRHFLNSRALLNPKNINLNAYGNIPRGRLKALKGKPNVFIGSVKTKAGMVDGAWQRIPASKGKPAHLKLLIRFGDALPVRQRLGYVERARRLIDANFDKEFGRAMAKAIATAKG